MVKEKMPNKNSYIITLYEFKKIESMRNWLTYNPACFKEKEELGLYTTKEEDDTIIASLNEFYETLIEEYGENYVEKQRANAERAHYDLGIKKHNNPIVFTVPNSQTENYDRIVEVLSVFNIGYYADLKLTGEEKKQCHKRIKKCSYLGNNIKEYLNDNTVSPYLKDYTYWGIAKLENSKYIDKLPNKKVLKK